MWDPMRTEKGGRTVPGLYVLWVLTAFPAHFSYFQFLHLQLSLEEYPNLKTEITSGNETNSLIALIIHRFFFADYCLLYTSLT
jgi:hypothetical protein